MILIVGLGNPGKKYQKTRHNLGFQVIDEFFEKNKDIYHFSNFQFEKKFQTEISRGKINKKEIILAKPQTFMNNSGKPIKLLLQKYCNKKAMAMLLQQKILWVIHDDLDLPLGKIKISFGRGSAGHKGVQSIIDELKTKNFVRFRIGIQPIKKRKQNIKIEKFVLEKFSKSEEKILKNVIQKTIETIKLNLIKFNGQNEIIL